mgnify:CR=1 FL=1
MAAVFLKLLNLSISASWLVLAVLVLRLISKRSPKWVNVLLWGIVALRLVLPFSIESALSLIPSAETVSPAAVQFDPAPTITSGVSVIDNAVNPSLSEHFAAVPTASVNPLYAGAYIAGWAWLIGLGAMLLYALASYLRLRRRVSVSLPIQDHIYLCDAISSPFILGVVKPRIYLPSGLDEVQRQNVLSHERAHLARRDHWWKPLGFALLAVYWFNPVLWLAYTLLCRDIELACDERVIRTMDESAVKTYSTVLLACSMPRKAVITCPLAFGEVGVKERVKNALHYKKPAFWVVAASVAVCVVVAVCFLTDPPTDTDAAGLVGFHREQVTYADVTGASGAQPSNIQLTAEETDAVYALLDTLQYKRLGTASAMQDCYARLYFISAAGERCEVMLSEREMLVNPITDGRKARLYELRSGSTELRDYLFGCIGASDAEEKPLDEASLREQLINALDSADAVYFEPYKLDSNQSEGPVTDAKYVDEICSLLRQIEPANDVEWPAKEERFILSNASFMLLSGHDAEDLATADCVTMTPRYYILTDRDNERTLIFVHNGGKSYGNENYQLIGKLPFTGLDYTIAMDRRLQEHNNLALTGRGGGQAVILMPFAPDAASTTGYAAYDALLAEISGLRRSGASDVQTDFSHDLLSVNDYYQTPGWLLRDLDGDGIPELLLGANWDEGHTVIFNIYRYGGTRAVRVVNGWNRNRWYLCTDGSLANEGSSSAFESSYSYYRYTSGELQHLETLLYLDDGSGGSPWRYSVTTDQYVNSGDFHSVTEAEATAVMDKYTHETLAFTPFVV